MNTSLSTIEKALVAAKPQEQRQFLARLPRLLKISITDLTFTKLSEKSFGFWDNDTDSIYDKL